MKNKLFCVTGRTGSGKDTLVHKIVEDGLGTQVISYTDGSKRGDQTEGVEHYFLTPSEFDDILNTEEVLAYTKINNKRYCATAELLKRCSKPGIPLCYIIDPNGIKSLPESIFDQWDIYYIYIWAPETLRMNRCNLSRGGFDFHTRNEAESEQFTDFERNFPVDIIVVNIRPAYQTYMDLCSDMHACGSSGLPKIIFTDYISEIRGTT